MKNPIGDLLISTAGHPDDPAWSPQAHVVDDLMRRAAYFGLMGRLGGYDVDIPRQACIEAAKKIAAEQWTDYNVEFHVKMWEETTESAFKEWCETHHMDWRLPTKLIPPKSL